MSIFIFILLHSDSGLFLEEFPLCLEYGALHYFAFVLYYECSCGKPRSGRRVGHGFEGQYGVENVFIGQPAIVGAHGIVRPVNIPLNDAETQKMQASAKELQAIIDEAWKNPEFQAASKN